MSQGHDDPPRLVLSEAEGDGADSEGGDAMPAGSKRRNSDSITIMVTPPDERKSVPKWHSQPHLRPPEFDNSPPLSRRAQWEKNNLPSLSAAHNTSRPHTKFTKTTVHVQDSGRLSEPVVLVREERAGLFTPSPEFADPPPPPALPAPPSPPSSPSWSITPPPSPPPLSPPGSPGRRTVPLSPGVHLSPPEDDEDMRETRKVVQSLQREVHRERERVAPVRQLVRSFSVSSASSTSSSVLPGGGGSVGGGGSGGGGGQSMGGAASASAGASASRSCGVCSPPSFLPTPLHPVFNAVVGAFGISDVREDWPIVLDVARLALALVALALLPLSRAAFAPLFLLSSLADATHEHVCAFFGRPGDVNPLLHALTDRLLLPCALLAVASYRPRTVGLCLAVLALVVSAQWFDVVASLLDSRDRSRGRRSQRDSGLGTAPPSGEEQPRASPQPRHGPRSLAVVWERVSRLDLQGVVALHDSSAGVPEATVLVSHVFVVCVLQGQVLGLPGLLSFPGFVLSCVVRAWRLSQALHTLQRVGPGKLRKLKFH